MFSLSYRIIDAPPNIALDHNDNNDVLGQVVMDFDGQIIGEINETPLENVIDGDSLFLWFDLLVKVIEQLDQFSYALQLYTGQGMGEIEYKREGDVLSVSLVRVKNPYDYAFDITKARALDITYVGWRNIRIDYPEFKTAILSAIVDFGYRLEMVRPDLIDTPDLIKLMMQAEAMRTLG